MSEDLINKIKWDDPRHVIVFQCAPVLWGIKASNLLVIDNDKLEAVPVFISSFWTGTAVSRMSWA